ncbi:MAG: sensor histidine kinase [Cyclobacteriaceae bacterium]
MRKYLLLATGCTGLGVLLFIFIHYSENGSLAPLHLWKKYLLLIALTNVLGFIIFQIDQLLDKFIHWKSQFLLRFVSGLVGNVLTALFFISLLGKYLFGLSPEGILKLNVAFTIIVFIYEIFYGLFYSYHHYAVTQAEQLRSDRWQLELQFESLKNQISPHYLFNCLNTVSSLLFKDTRVAEEFIRRMADTFRYVLSHQKQKLVSLREELEFVKSYYFLLQVRYEYHLKLEINIPQNILDSSIPPMTLQLLVENAVKHNKISKENPLLVYIGAQDNQRIVISNTKTSGAQAVTSFRVGLENIHKRYSFFTNEKVVVRDEEKFLVMLPVLKKTLSQVSSAKRQTALNGLTPSYITQSNGA